MLRIKPLFILCAALLTVTPAASADVNSDMNQFSHIWQLRLAIAQGLS